MDENGKYNGIGFEKKGSSIASWLRKNIISLFLFAISTWYIFSGAVKFSPAEMEWWEKICYIGTTMVFGVIISSLVSEGGYEQGKKEDIFISTRTAAIELAEKAVPHRAEAELFVRKRIKNDIRIERSEILKKTGLKYEQIFDENDKLIILNKEFVKKLKKDQKKAIKIAARIKMYDFVLFGFSSIKSVGRRPAPSEIKRRKGKISSNLVKRALTAIITGSIMFNWIGLSWATVLYSIFQLLIWWGSGLVARVDNYNFIVNDIREYDQERIWQLKSFIALSPEELEKLTNEVRESSKKEEKVLMIAPVKNEEETI